MTAVSKNFVNVEWLKSLAEEAMHIKQRSYDLMRVQSDSHVLDVGCGPAVDTIPLSEYIGDRGIIVGVDLDLEMIKAANRELEKIGATKSIQHIQGSVFSLPFRDGGFNRIHLERLFQVFPKTAIDPIFAELNRVLASNGRIVMVDMDLATLSVNFSDNEFERKVINHFGLMMRPNGFAGRQLTEILQKNNYKDVSTEFITHSLGNLTRDYFLNWIISGAVADEIITQTQADSWNQELKRKVDAGTFLASVTNVLVSGVKP